MIKFFDASIIQYIIAICNQPLFQALESIFKDVHHRSTEPKAISLYLCFCPTECTTQKHVPIKMICSRSVTDAFSNLFHIFIELDGNNEISRQF